MKRLLAGLLLLTLAACVPSLAPQVERDGELVSVRIAPERDLFDVTLSVKHATTDDARCVVLNVTDLGCVLGDLSAGSETTVRVAGEPGSVSCVLFGYVSERRGATDYRSFPCSTGG